MEAVSDDRNEDRLKLVMEITYRPSASTWISSLSQKATFCHRLTSWDLDLRKKNAGKDHKEKRATGCRLLAGLAIIQNRRSGHCLAMTNLMVVLNVEKNRPIIVVGFSH